jgi:hypothetical protein
MLRCMLTHSFVRLQRNDRILSSDSNFIDTTDPRNLKDSSVVCLTVMTEVDAN